MSKFTHSKLSHGLWIKSFRTLPINRCTTQMESVCSSIENGRVFSTLFQYRKKTEKEKKKKTKGLEFVTSSS